MSVRLSKPINLAVGVSLSSVSLTAACPAQPDSGGQQERPNILCIVCEDIGPYIGCFGDPMQGNTPNLDKFSEGSIRYTRMFSSLGVSAPSRFSLITGMYPSSCGANNMRTQMAKSKPEGITPYSVVTPEGVRCYTEYMREAGYYCTNNSKTDYQFAAPLSAWDENGAKAHWCHCPDGMPFFSIFNLNVTHESQIWGRVGKPLSVSPDKVPVPPYYPDDPIIRKDIAVMYSNIHEMDRQVQILIDELKEAGLYDNTVIIWYSDNGGPLPRQKREIYESGMHVPFMIHFPDGYRAGEIDDRLVAFVDIPATILSIAGLEPPEYMHGRPFLGQYESGPRKYVYGAHDRMDTQVDKIGCVRDSRYRYIRNYMPERSGYMPVEYRMSMPMMRRMLEMYGAGLLDEVQSRWFQPRPEEEFYDVEADPHEVHNLIDNPAYASEIKRLRNAYDKWVREYNEDWFLSEEEKISLMLPGGNQPETTMPSVEFIDGKLILSSATDGASIVYKVNGEAYGKKGQWYLYSGPICPTGGDEITAMAVRIGYENSDILNIQSDKVK